MESKSLRNFKEQDFKGTKRIIIMQAFQEKDDVLRVGEVMLGPEIRNQFLEIYLNASDDKKEFMENEHLGKVLHFMNFF